MDARFVLLACRRSSKQQQPSTPIDAVYQNKKGKESVTHYYSIVPVV
jgi:hypothetical protein